MRLIGSFDNEKVGKAFSWFLSQEGIENSFELNLNTDWGSNNYGQNLYFVWVYDENQWEKAKVQYDEFKKNPNDPRFLIKGQQPLESPTYDIIKGLKAGGAPKVMYGRSGITTLYILLTCCLVFIWTLTHEKPIIDIPPYLPPLAVESSVLKKSFLFDYPDTFRLADKLVLLYGIDNLRNPDDLPLEGKALLNQYFDTPYWKGVYDMVIKMRKNASYSYEGSLFERIREGELVRLFTPCLLHADIFHLLFNMIWLMLLGPQIENRIGKLRYLLFILFVACFSNTAQYLMSGSNFLGYSGVICGMITFIWTRQQSAPWEGYLLHRSTLIFISFFIIAMFSLQLVSFFLEIFKNFSLAPGIANTAHLSGAFAGYLLGKLNFFSIQAK